MPCVFGSFVFFWGRDVGVAVPCEESDQIQIRRLYSRVKGKEQRVRGCWKDCGRRKGRRMKKRTAKLSAQLCGWVNVGVFAFVLGLFAARGGVHET
jgi:hypothetical protein